MRPKEAVERFLKRLRQPQPTLSPEEAQVISALENPRYDWRTMDGIERETGLNTDQVVGILKSPAVNSRLAIGGEGDDQGRTLFTTKGHYNRKAGFINRFTSTAH